MDPCARGRKRKREREREREREEKKGYTKRCTGLLCYQRRPVPMPDSHGISPTRSRGEGPLLVSAPIPDVPAPPAVPAPALVTREINSPVPKGGEGVPNPEVSLAVRRATGARFLGAIALFGVSKPLRDGLSAGARLGSISRASSRTSTAPSSRRSDATAS